MRHTVLSTSLIGAILGLGCMYALARYVIEWLKEFWLWSPTGEDALAEHMGLDAEMWMEVLVLPFMVLL